MSSGYDAFGVELTKFVLDKLHIYCMYNSVVAPISIYSVVIK